MKSQTLTQSMLLALSLTAGMAQASSIFQLTSTTITLAPLDGSVFTVAKRTDTFSLAAVASAHIEGCGGVSKPTDTFSLTTSLDGSAGTALSFGFGAGPSSGGSCTVLSGRPYFLVIDSSFDFSPQKDLSVGSHTASALLTQNDPTTVASAQHNFSVVATPEPSSTFLPALPDR